MQNPLLVLKDADVSYHAVNRVVEDEERTIPSADGEEVVVPVDITKPNPNGEEFDNLYLDMNGIVSTCWNNARHVLTVIR